MSPQPSPAIKPLLTSEQMAQILSSRRSLTSEQAYQAMAAHLKKPLSPGRKRVSRRGQKVWASC